MSEGRDWFAEQLRGRLDAYLRLSSEQIDTLFAHFGMLQRWNAKINLTSIRSAEEIVLRHYCESLFFAAVLKDIQPGARLADVGSGAGFPGVPLAILRSDCCVTLVESHKRKAVFLRESTRSLPQVDVVAGRAEDLSNQFEWVISRAVKPEDVIRLVPRIGAGIALLVGSDIDSLRQNATINWSEAIQIPWSERRFAIVGVPRETS